MPCWEVPGEEGGAGRRVHIRAAQEDIDTGEGGRAGWRAPVDDLPMDDSGESEGLRAGRVKAAGRNRGAMGLRRFHGGGAGMQEIGRGVLLFAVMLLCMEEAAAVPPVAPTGLQVCPNYSLALFQSSVSQFGELVYLGSPIW